ncbi:MAG: hypothetical protein D6733_05800 [Methanobacteriota archaeon]|nr:MAG: hypothetical protein D6733_05800 [Euryarchaeota archaeon]
MGLVIESFKESLRIIRENKVILGVALIYVIISYTSFIRGPLNIPDFFTLFIVPFFVGGIFGMSLEALKGKTKLATFAEVGEKNYIRLLIASALFTIIVGFADILEYLRIQAFSRFDLYGKVSFSIIHRFHLILLIVSAVGLIFMFFLQFFHIGIVAKNYGVLESFKESYRFTRKQIKEVFHFFLLRLLVEGIDAITRPLIYFYNTGRLWERFPEPVYYSLGYNGDITGVALIITVMALSTISLALTLTFTAVFYVRAQESGRA